MRLGQYFIVLEQRSLSVCEVNLETNIYIDKVSNDIVPAKIWLVQDIFFIVIFINTWFACRKLIYCMSARRAKPIVQQKKMPVCLHFCLSWGCCN